MMSPRCAASFRDGASYAKGGPSAVAAAGKLPAFKCTDDGIAVAYLATRRVYQIRAPLHLPDQRVVEEVFGLRVQWSVDCNTSQTRTINSTFGW